MLKPFLFLYICVLLHLCIVSIEAANHGQVQSTPKRVLANSINWQEELVL